MTAPENFYARSGAWDMDPEFGPDLEIMQYRQGDGWVYTLHDPEEDECTPVDPALFVDLEEMR